MYTKNRLFYGGFKCYPCGRILQLREHFRNVKGEKSAKMCALNLVDWKFFIWKKKKWLKKFLIQKRQTAVAALELLNKQQTRQRFLEQLWQAEFALCNYKRVRQTQTTAATTPRPSDTDI